MDYPAPRPQPDEDDVLDLTLEDEAPDPAGTGAAAGVLDVVLDDETTATEGLYPEVTEVQQQAALPGVSLQCACSATREGFEVRFEERDPGVYWAAEVIPGVKGEPPPAGKASGLEQIKGTFRMGPDFRCPRCGSDSLSVCEACQAVLCGGGTTKGGGCPCPGCGTELTLTSEAATSAPGAAGGKKKPRW